MAKNLKINIKNTQIAQAVNLGNIKKTVLKKKEEKEVNPEAQETAAIQPEKAKTSPAKTEEKAKPEIKAKTEVKAKSEPKAKPAAVQPPVEEEVKEEAPRMKARSKSAFAEPHQEASHMAPAEEQAEVFEHVSEPLEEFVPPQEIIPETPEPAPQATKEDIQEAPIQRTSSPTPVKPAEPIKREVIKREPPKLPPKPEVVVSSHHKLLKPKAHTFLKDLPVREKFGPTGKHVKDLVPPKRPTPPPMQSRGPSQGGYQGNNYRPAPGAPPREGGYRPGGPPRPQGPRPAAPGTTTPAPAADGNKEAVNKAKFKEYRDVKPAKRTEAGRFDSRDRQGLSAGEDDSRWRKRKSSKQSREDEDVTIRPTALKVRIPILLKDLAAEMKLKASQLIQKLFLQGVVVTLNSILDDETTIQLLGHEFGCAITIDTSKEDRIRITDKTIQQEISESDEKELVIRPPVVAFMGHVDHGKTSLIDYIRKSNRASGEAGAITQHIGAFMCSTAVGDIAFLDTPGHEAFSAMRARGANITDIVVLVVAGDEGIRQQTIEAIQHAKAAGVIIVVAINKSDKPNFNPETVYRQLSEQELLPEAWGGQTITVNCSAITGDGIKELLEMLALQAEVLELRANPKARARGSVIESEMHKGLGAKATVLVQNGTLKKGDALVFESFWGRIKTMYDENGKEIDAAGPSHPVEITGLSGLPEAGQEFIVVRNEKEAKEISDMRTEGLRQTNLLQKKKLSVENLLTQASASGKKMLNIVLRADVQGSLEALKVALEKIESSKADLNIIFAGVGEISESDVQLAAASKAVILGFHTQIESHADQLVKEMGVIVKLHDIIYHAIDEIKALMQGLLDKISVETERGKALVKAVFKSSQLGLIAGCQVMEGVINRNYLIRVRRGNDVVFKGTIASLKKVKEDVREVSKGIECGILINGFNDAKENDIIEAYEITYLSQDL